MKRTKLNVSFISNHCFIAWYFNNTVNSRIKRNTYTYVYGKT